MSNELITRIKMGKFLTESVERLHQETVQAQVQSWIDAFPDTAKIINRDYSTPIVQMQTEPPAPEPLKIKQQVIINTYYGPWHNANGVVVEALGKGMYKVSVTNLGTTRVLPFHRSELIEVTT